MSIFQSMAKKIDLAEKQKSHKNTFFSYGVGEGIRRFPIWANSALRGVDSFVSGIWLWGTCKGRLGEPGKKGAGGTEGGGRLEPAH